VSAAGVEMAEDKVDSMIQLTRLNNRPLVVNCDLIKFIENTPDTVLTLITGEKVVVLESCEVVIEKVVEFRRKAPVGVICGTATSQGEFDEKNVPPTAENIED